MEATASEEALRCGIRPYTEADLAFIFATWLRNYLNPTTLDTRRRGQKFASHHILIERFLKRGGAVLVAHDPEDPSVIYGYLAGEVITRTISGREVASPVVQYLYVKGPFRGFGIATALTKAAGLDLNKAVFTHDTPGTRRLMKRYPGAELCPDLM